MGNKCCTCKESGPMTHEIGEQSNPLSTPTSPPSRRTEDKTADEYRSRANNMELNPDSALVSRKRHDESDIDGASNRASPTCRLRPLRN